MARRKPSGAPLTAAFVRTVSEPGRYGDGRGGYGLSLLVKKQQNGRTSKTWSQRLLIDRKPRMIGLGAYPVVTLKVAREKALANRRLLAEGKDPRGGGVPTFEAATERLIVRERVAWKPGSTTEATWRNGFATHVYPKLGSMRVDKITTADVLAVLEPIWHSKPSLAEGVIKRRIVQVMAWAIGQGWRHDNPAGEKLAAALPKNGRRTKHHRALAHGEVAAALRMIDGSGAALVSKLALRFLALTASRKGEALGARWSEIDTEVAVWTIPAERTKTGKAHRVPLSAEAAEVLDNARELWGGSGVVFVGRGGKPVNPASPSALFRRLGIAGTPHGLRSSFRDWCGETGVAREVAEACLAHTVRGVEGAYARSDLLDRRRVVMEAWGRYLSS